MLFRVATVIAMTYWVQENVTVKSFKRHAEDWTYLQVFFLSSYAIQNCVCITTIEEAYRNNLLRTVFFMGGLIISYLIGDFAEDFFFDDIGKWGGIWHNWGTFVAPLSMILAGFVCAHFWI